MKTNTINDYEYSNYSQNGEDGIIEFLSSKLIQNSKFFVELGCSNGLENNSRNLIINGWSGIVCDIENNINSFLELLKTDKPKGKIDLAGGKITLKNIKEIIKKISNKDIDFFSIDIDSYDFYILNEILKNKIYPKIICVEYNSFFGKKPLTVKYLINFNRYKFDNKRGLYFGASLEAWKVLLKKFNYKFLCVDSNGVNAFFILPKFFYKNITRYKGLDFAYTRVFVNKYKLDGKVLENELLNNFRKLLVNINDLI